MGRSCGPCALHWKWTWIENSSPPLRGGPRGKLLMQPRLLLVAAWVIAVPLASLAQQEQAGPRLHVPPGFVIEKAAGEPDVVFPMFAAFDNHGRLFVTESSGLDLYAELQKQTRHCRVRILEGRDTHGRFRTAHVFADRLVFPMGVAWYAGKLYVPDPPDVTVLEDTKGTGKADRRIVLLSGFGHRDNGALHGLMFGPDGLLYLTTGHPDGYQIKQADGRIIKGRSGGLLRCRPDGSHPEVLCRGFENLVEVAFTPDGEIIGTDNWFSLPHAGVRDALVHLVEGGLYPHHLSDEGTPQFLTNEPLPAVARYPAVALSGLVRYRGEAFPPSMWDNLFSAQHNARKVMRHVLIAEGSTFRSEDHDFVTTDDPDFHPSDVLEDADGSLLVVDTGSWYVQHCPTGRIRKVHKTGGIYRVRPVKFTPPADPWGEKISWDKLSPSELAGLLADRRPMVRDRARLALAAGGRLAVPALAALLDSPAAPSASKQRALWALAAMRDKAALPPLRKALRVADPAVAAVAARGLARQGDQKAVPELTRLLTSSSLPLRRAAAEALAHCGDGRALPAIWKTLAAGPDRFLEHSLLYAAHQLADKSDLEKVLNHPSPRVHKAALLLLDQPPRPTGSLSVGPVLEAVAAKDADLRQAALFILRRHPEWADRARALLRGWLAQSDLTKEQEHGLRGLLLAFQGQKAVQDLIAEAAAGRAKVPPPQRALVLEIMAQSPLPRLPPSWFEALVQALHDPLPAVRRQAVQTASILQLPQLDKALAALAERPNEPAELRLEAARTIAPRQPHLSDKLFDLLLQQLGDKDNPLGRLAAVEVLGRCHLTEKQFPRLLAALRGDALASPSVLLPALVRSVTAANADAVLDYLQEAIQHGWRPREPDWGRFLKALPVSARPRAAKLQHLLTQRQAGQAARLRQLTPLLQGGDPERGRAVFFGKKVACASCHSLGNQGGKVGPDLTRIGAVRSGPDLLEAVVVPSASIAQGYESYLAVTKDGRTLTGIISRQTAEVVLLRDSSGAETRLPREQIQELVRLPTSLMPEGLDQALSTEELRDLLAFLQSRR
jgi:putative membrane-bound dehydrogenase-like protein